MAERIDKKTRLNEMVKKAEIDWKNLHIDDELGGWWDCAKFNIQPDEFLSYAKEDYRANTRRGFVNALSNSKRAIDSQADNILLNYGFDPTRIEKKNVYPGVRFSIEKFRKENELLSDVPLKFKFLQSIGIAPQSVILRVRKLRNLLEHEYKIPEKQDVLESIEIAEMFIKSSRHTMFDLATGGFLFGTDYYIEESGRLRQKRFRKCINVNFNCYEDRYDKVNFYIMEMGEKKDDIRKIAIHPEDESYIYFLYIHLTRDWSLLPLAFGVDAANVNIKMDGVIPSDS